MSRHPEWRQDNRRGGGATLEWMIHEVDYVRWLGVSTSGPLTRMVAAVHYTDPAHPHFDTLLRALLTFARGATGEVDGSLIAPLGGGTARGVIGTRGMAVTQGDTLRVQKCDGSPAQVMELHEVEERQRLGANPGIFKEDQEFIRAIQEGRTPAIPGEEGRDSLLACLGILQASRQGRPLDPREVR
jgi:predicted dehydrogenase